MMQHSDNYDPSVNWTPPRRRRYLLWVGLVMGLGVIVGGLFLALGNKNRGFRASATQEAALRATLTTAMNENGLNAHRLNLLTSYQGKALDWLLTDPKLDSYDRSEVLQRFTMACFYYSTNGIVTLYTPRAINWKDSTGWLTQKSECEWLGIQCSTKSKVNGISLEDNGLTGALPQELVFLKDHITTIDLTTNFLYMNGDDFNVFSELYRLETLLIDDNFLSTTDGLPTSFTSLTSLKMLRLSYNLLGGSLTDNMVRSWPKLTHLEIESNYLEGKLPTALGSMQQLVYLYVRRNAFSGSLDFLKVGQMSNLFAFWVDSNFVTGGIPTEIGLANQLASISMTNCTLTGTIPTELGKLTDLRRLWLYDNDLRGSIPTQLSALTAIEVLEMQSNPQLGGTMPSAVCSAVAAATYESKSLLADCATVVCANCCTTCDVV